MLSGRVVTLDEAAKWDFAGVWKRLITRSGDPSSAAVTFAMNILGRQFVLAGPSAKPCAMQSQRWTKAIVFSFDMLGEAAYTRDDAARYYKAYDDALGAIAAHRPDLQSSYWSGRASR